MRVAVTGASGFVGGAVARALLAQGHEIVTFARRDPEILGAQHFSWDLTTGPLATPPCVDAVVHAAAAVADGLDLDTAYTVNVGGTALVRETFPRARFVHISSASVYDPMSPSSNARETEAPVTDYLNAYGETKAAAERLLAEDVAAHPGRGDVVVLRPHAIYGPGDTTLLPRIEASVRAGVLVLPDGGRSRHSLTHIETLIAAVQAALGLPALTEGRLVANVADASPVVLRDALRDALSRRGHRVRIVAVPSGVLWRIAERLEARGRTPRLSRYALSHLAMERTYDLTVLREVLGVSPAATSFVGAEDW